MTEHDDVDLDGTEDLDPQDAADADQPYGEVTAEDLATDEQIGDGGDAAMLLPDDTARPVDKALHTDDLDTDETIEERLPQEEPDPAAEVAYGPDGTDPT